VLMKASEDKTTTYAAVVIICAIVMRVLIGWAEATLFSLPHVI